MVIRSLKTLERYTSLYKKLQVKYSLSDIAKWSFSDFKKKTSYTSKGSFKLARSLARNVDLQKQLNIHIKKISTPKIRIKPIKIKEYIPKIKLIPTKLVYKSFTKIIPKFKSVKGLETYIKTDASRLSKDTQKALYEVLSKAKRQTQKFSGKQIKINITSEITPNKKLDADFREKQTRSSQTKARMFTADLDDDLDDIMDMVNRYIQEYDPKGSCTITISIVNYTV